MKRALSCFSVYLLELRGMPGSKRNKRELSSNCGSSPSNGASAEEVNTSPLPKSLAEAAMMQLRVFGC